MRRTLSPFYIKTWKALKQDHGQDLVEYALVLCLVVLAGTAGMKTLANGINTACSNVSDDLILYINTGHGNSGSAPGHGGTPPGQGGTPPGHS